MDAINRFGRNLYNDVLPNNISKITNNQKKEWEIDVPNLKKKATVNLDYRLTSDPKIHNRVMDLDFYFDIGSRHSHCVLEHTKIEYDFEHFD
jgi:hypothetical protein